MQRGLLRALSVVSRVLYLGVSEVHVNGCVRYAEDILATAPAVRPPSLSFLRRQESRNALSNRTGKELPVLQAE